MSTVWMAERERESSTEGGREGWKERERERGRESESEDEREREAGERGEGAHHRRTSTRSIRRSAGTCWPRGPGRELTSRPTLAPPRRTPARLELCYQSNHYRRYQSGPDNSCYRTYQLRADNSATVLTSRELGRGLRDRPTSAPPLRTPAPSRGHNRRTDILPGP